MDHTYAKSRKDRYGESNRGSSPDRIEATRRTLGATQMNDSNDYGFDWLQNGYDWEATRRDEYSKSRREPTDEWTDFGATMKDEHGNNRRDGLGRTMKENLGATRRNHELGATRRNDELGATRRNDELGATRRNDELGATRRNDDLGATRRNDDLGVTRRFADVGVSMRYGASQNYDLGATRRNGLGATRHVDLGATGDTRREAFGSSAVDKLRGSAYPAPTQENPPIPYYREIAASGNYGVSMVNKEPFHEGPPLPILEPAGYVVEGNRYAIHDGQTLGPRRWTSLAADGNLMEEWHNMFGQIRKKWTPVPSSRLDDDVTISKWSGDQSSSYSTRRRLNKRALIIIVSIVAVVLIVAAVVPTVILTQHKDKEGEVYLEYEYQATIKNRNYDSSMEDPNSEEFKDVENEFCSQLNENARDSGVAKGFNYHGCAVTEIKSGSLVIRYVIIIRTVNAAPSATEVTAVVSIKVDVNEQTVGAFVVVNFLVLTETPKVITSDQNPAIIAKQFNETCTGVKKERCVTKHSQCLDGMCKCPVGRTHNTTSDSCITIDCGNEYAIANGNATSNGTQYNASLNISCADGFELSTNDTVIFCTSPRSWLNLPKCMPVVCPEFIKPNNSEIDTNSSGRIYRDVIKITCDTGYQVDGNLSSVECFANQSWSESPVCQIVTCQTFETPDNAAITPDLQQFDYDANVSVLCNIGFDIQGENNVTCLANGTWTDIPKCVTLECNHLAIANATFEPTNQPYQYLDNVTVNCNDGYILEGNNTVTCTTNGSWSELPTCMPINCDHLELTSAIFEPSEQPYQYLDNITVDCNDGYTLEGNNTVSCTMNGTWSGLPACTPIDCDLLNITDAIFEPSVQPYTYLDNVTVDCTDGYILEGSKTVSCKSNGTWSELPTCMPMNCDPLEITNAIFEPSEQPYQYLDNITVDCNDGFTLEGNNTVSCMTNGTWSGLPACTPIDCDLLNIADAIFEPSVQPYKYLDNVTVDCTDGYTLEGSKTVSCKSNGTWSELPTCVQINCDPLEITNAFFSPNKSQFLYGENVTVGCGLGFQIQGANVLSCQTNGSWKEAPTCDAIVCKLFNLSENIKIISEDKSIYSYNENVTLDCENGYVINGNATVKCQGDASWTELPTCRAINCSDFEVPSMAINNSKLNDLTFDDSVYITCESGFVLVGDSNITCKADGTWPTIACVEANCSAEDFSKPNNSRVSTTSESGTVFEFECVEGYNLEGNSSVSCISGNWSSFPSCELVDCGSYGLIDNGNVSSGTGTKYDDTVEISCLENFKLIGGSQGICLQNGSWTEKPVCMRLECQKFIVPENAMIPENINETAVGTNITLVCIGGYDLVGAEIVMCQGNETWSEIPDCKLKDCGPPNNINNSKLTGLDKTTFNSTFTVECEDGYDLKGESILQCQINGSWTKYPSCEIKDCGEIGELGNGTIVNQAGTLFGSTAYAICNDGYGLVGKENLTCEANGEWDMLPICIKTECGVYTPPDNAIFGSDYKISCKEGYELIGEATIECLNGNWSGNGTCKRIQCKTLPQIDNADVEPDSGNYFGDTLKVSCKLGFELSNSLKAECDSNKTWINVPTCNPISCGNYSLPPYSEISEISTTTGVFEDTINITCSTGFDIEGENYVICNATGEWENDPVCIPKACGKFETPDHATVPDDTNLDGFTYNQSITVTCDTGYNISGNSVVLCGADAKWDSSPLCLPVNCPVLTLDDNTFIDRNETNFVYNDSVEISCDEGFNLTGNAQIFCTAQGNWTEIPSCNKINCRTFVIPANADIGLQSLINHSYNDIINVTCNDGYIITNNTQAICGSDGDWKNIPMCQPVNCSVINIPENAIIEDQMQDGHNYKDIVEIKCKEGYMLNGSNKIECLATGNWSDLPTCTKECDFIDSSDDGLIFPSNNRFFSNENISVSCAVGYELQGSEIVACNINGTWSDFPKCVPNDCEPLDIPVNAANLLNETQFRYKDNVTIECNVGYELSSKDTLNCHLNGTWTDIPSCDPIICTFLDLPENAEAFPNRTDYLFNDNITISCKDGFELEGDTIISCQPNGEWQGIPTCSSVKCNPFDGPNIATIYPDKQNYTYNESVTIECEAGYEIEGESTTQCQSKSSWSNIPTCRPITCDNLTLPENATTSSDVTVLKFDEEVSIICQSKLVMNISCFSNGTWPAIDCYSADCSIASVILPEHSKIKATDVPEGIYEIECIEGYKMIGNSSIQCLSGNWSDFPSCEIVECETSDLNSDTYTVDAESNSTIEYNSSVPITCLTGLAPTDESDKDLTCGSDGKFYGNPECKIPGSVTLIRKPPEFVVDLNGTLICEVKGNPQWQTVLLAKTGQTGDMNSPIYMISNSTGSVINTTLDKSYTVGYKLEQDGVSISLELLPVTCENEGNYICAVSVGGDIQNATDTKFANTSLEASCAGCGKHEPFSNTYEVDDNESTKINSTLAVTCIDGLELTDGSDKVVTCGSDGTWQGNPECKIPGSLTFTQSSLATNEDEALNITCNVTDNPIWQRLLLGKSDGDKSGSYSEIFMLSNVSGSVEVMKINESYTVSHELHATGVSITMTLDPVTCEDRGTYACVAMVGDPTNATDSKIASTQLNVSRDSVAPEITLPDRINVGERAKVECVGQIGKDYSGEITGQLLLETNFGENGSDLTYTSTNNPEDVGCFYKDSISALIPTASEAEDLWAQCVIQPKQGDAISSQKKNITINKSFVTFENSSYVFNIGENASLTCIVQNIKEWNRIEIKRSDGKVILGVNSSDQQPDSYESHVSLVSSESSFSNESAKVAVRFDAVNCSDTLDGVGDVEYICSVETNNSTMEDTATVTFQKKPGEPVLKMSWEIIENKFTLGDRMFSCEGELGNPPGSIEVQSNYKGTFETFLSLMPGKDNNTDGWIVNNETDTSNCGKYKKLNFAFHNITNDWQYKRLRCVIHPSDEIIGITDDLYEEKSINIIPDDICVGKDGFIPHPYFCYLNVECSRSDDGIDGVPKGCKENECMTTNYFCDECSKIGGCNITNVKCDKTSAEAILGEALTFTCNIQDFGEVTYISVNDQVESVISDTDSSVSVSSGVDATVSEANVVLSFSNVSCSQKGDYLIKLNNATDVTLSLRVISEPEKPVISMPGEMTANEATAINCSGKIGRDEQGNGKASIYLEVKFEDESEFTTYDADTTRDPEDKNCEILETVIFSVTPSVSWNNSFVRCTTKNDDASISMHSSQEHVILQTPGLFCNPMLLGSQLGESVTFNCALKDVQQINSFSISKNETDFINIDNVTVPFEEGEEDAPFTVSIPASLEQLTITFTDIKCENEGEYSININNKLSAILTLRVLTSTAMPSLTKPVTGKLNEKMEITCNGEVGRDIDGNEETEMFIEVQFEMETNFSIINTNVETDVPMLDNCIYSQEARLILYPDISWNNSFVRCASWNASNIVKSSASEKIKLLSPNTYFQDTNVNGIIGETVTLTCIMKNMNNLTDIFIRKGENRTLIASHKGGSINDSVTVITNEIAMDESEGTMEINITLSCGDDGKYFCQQDSLDTPSEAVSVITTGWKAEKPVLDPSVDMVENSPPWAAFATTCTGEMGTFQDSTIYLESNIDGDFTKIVGATVEPATKDLGKCTNKAMVTFHNTYTSAWNDTILRCVVETDDETLMDAEYVRVIPENFCDNITDNTIIDHPFDCRGRLTCGGARKITALREGDCGIEECYKPAANSNCIPCADKCRPDPLDSGE